MPGHHCPPNELRWAIPVTPELNTLTHFATTIASPSSTSW
jgi:hypothetical protein